MTSAVVTFDIAAFRARYPGFAAVLPDTLSAYFTEACLYCDNTPSSLISDTAARSVILNMIVAHIAQLASQPAGLVGNVTSARVGNVMTTLQSEFASGSKAWFNQTQYGRAAWQAMMPYGKALFVLPD